MSYSKRLVVLMASFFSTLLFLSLMALIMKPIINNIDPNITYYVVYPLYSTLTFLFFIFFHGFLRKFFYRKYLKESTLFLSIKADKITITDRLWYFIFLGLIYILPIVRGTSTGYLFIITILLLILTILVLELILRASLKTININFLRSGIIIYGFDVRFNIPMEGLGTAIRNDFGYYSYYDIDSYYIFPDRVELYLVSERGKIVLQADSESLRQLQGILVQQKIEVRKFV